MRVVGGGGVTNTAQNKEEKRAGYSPSKVKPFELSNESEVLEPIRVSPLKRRKSLPESPIKQIHKTIEAVQLDEESDDDDQYLRLKKVV